MVFGYRNAAPVQLPVTIPFLHPGTRPWRKAIFVVKLQWFSVRMDEVAP